MLMEIASASLGASSVQPIVVSVAELVGATTVVTWVDRIGKRRALIGGLLVNAACFVAARDGRFTAPSH